MLSGNCTRHQQQVSVYLSLISLLVCTCSMYICFSVSSPRKLTVTVTHEVQSTIRFDELNTPEGFIDVCTYILLLSYMSN